MYKAAAHVDGYHNVPEIAAIYNVSETTVRGWIRRDALRPDTSKERATTWIRDDELKRFDDTFGDIFRASYTHPNARYIATKKGILFTQRLRNLNESEARPDDSAVSQPQPEPQPEKTSVGTNDIRARWSRVSRARADRDSLMNIASAFCERLGIPEDAAIIDAVKHSPAYLSADEAYRSEKAAFNEWFCQDSVIELAVTSLTAA